MKKTTYIKAFAISGVFAAASAQGAVWNGLGVGDEFSTAANWDDNLAPSSGSTQDIDTAVTVERSVDSTAGRTFLNNGAILNVTGGVHTDNNSGGTQRNFVGNSGDGTVNQSGGSYDVGHMLAIGRNGAGIYNLSGGSLDVSRGGNTLAGNPNTFGGNSGGSISVGWGTGSGLMNITGGSLVTRIGVEVGATGTFQVLGNGASLIGIGSSGTLDGHWWQEAGGVLSMGIGATGITKILIDDTGQADPINPYAHFQSGAILDMSFFGTSAVAGTWTLMELENQAIDDQGLVLAAGDAAAGWSFAVDNTGTNGLLTATYTVPEPSSAALLGLGGLALILRRRK